MRASANLKRLVARVAQLWETEGTEIIEFAVSMPLLVVLVVGIYDFGTAFTLKHKLSGAAREGARVAASQLHPPNPGVNGGCGAPSSICVIRDVVSSSLIASNGGDCGLGSANGSPAGSEAWTFAGSCPGLSLKIERGSVNPNTASLPGPFDNNPYVVENTKVTLVYPYEWRFNQAFKLLDSNANYFSSTITVAATTQNMD